MNKKYGITGLLVIVVLATVLVSGCIGEENKFTNTVTFEGMTFYLPDGFKSVHKEQSEYMPGLSEVFSDGSYNITIGSLGNISKSSFLDILKLMPEVTNVDESASYGGYSGHTADYTATNGIVIKYFVFEKDGKTMTIGLNKELNFNEYMPKIIG